METFFISHGSPRLAINDALPVRPFLQSWSSDVFSGVPKAILIISAHWTTSVPEVNVVSGTNDLIYDFYGFPEEMYQLKYPAPGASELAKKVAELLKEAGFHDTVEDHSRGLDHGAWIPLSLMYPEANIPVCQLSVQPSRSALHHYKMGQALAPLRNEGILIIGSGNATHNLRMRGPRGPNVPVTKWAEDFDTWLKESLLDGRYDDVNNYLEKAPYAEMAHPWPEHFFPLHVALGAAGEKAKSELIHHSWTSSTISYASYKFTATM